MNCIVITGVDGVGKTTLAKELCRGLSKQGYEARYVYGRIVPVLSRACMWLGRTLLLSKSYKSNDYVRYREKTRKTLQNRLLVLPYLVSIWLDYFIETWVRFLPGILSPKILIVDRYVYDTVVSDIAAHVDLDVARFDRILETAFYFFPRVSRTYLMTAPEEVSLARKDDIPHKEYIRERQQWFHHLARRPEVRQLDGTLKVEENYQLILDDLMRIGLIEGELN